MSTKVKIINGCVFLAWLALIFLLLYRNHEGILLKQTHVPEGSFEKITHWYDIYAGPEKIGFASTSYEKAGNEIIIMRHSEMKIKNAGHERLAIEEMRCLTDTAYTIKSFEYTSHYKDEKGIKVTGKTEKESITFFLDSSEKKKVFVMPKDRDFYLPATFLPSLALKNPTLNSVLIAPLLDIINFKIIDLRVVLEEIRPVKVGINILSLYKFRAGNFIWWCNEKGIPVKEENPGGIKLYSQVELLARDPASRLLFDFTDAPFFQASKLLPEPEKLSRLKLRIKGFTLNQSLYRNSSATLNNDILSIEKDEIKADTFKLPYSEDKLREYTRPDPWISSNYKPLQDTGAIYARDFNYDAVSFGRYLTEYVSTLIKTMPLFTVRSSQDILKSLYGDFLESTIMYTTYSRAGGLPTRLIGGLVYKNGYFYFHTWPEIWLGKWVPVDPTFMQFPADVTHIPLQTGNVKDLLDLANQMKNIKIEILGES